MGIPTEKRRAVEKLLEFIPFFENAKEEDVCRWVTEEAAPDSTMPITYPMYRNELVDFVNAVYENDLLDTDYMNTMEKLSAGEIELENIAAGIGEQDFEMVVAFLTFIIRQEKFCYGLWAVAVRDRWFCAVLDRLKELREEN